MKIDHDVLLKEFYNLHKDSDVFKDLTIKDVDATVKGPFLMLKKIISSGTCQSVRLKYLGIFMVYPKKAQSFLKNMKIKFEEGEVKEKYYLTISNKINKFLKS